MRIALAAVFIASMLAPEQGLAQRFGPQPSCATQRELYGLVRTLNLAVPRAKLTITVTPLGQDLMTDGGAFRICVPDSIPAGRRLKFFVKPNEWAVSNPQPAGHLPENPSDPPYEVRVFRKGDPAALSDETVLESLARAAAQLPASGATDTDVGAPVRSLAAFWGLEETDALTQIARWEDTATNVERRGYAALVGGQFTKAATLLDSAFRTPGGTTPDLASAIAAAHFRAGNKDVAEQWLKNATGQFPDDFVVLHNYGIVLKSQSKLLPADAVLKQSLLLQSQVGMEGALPLETQRAADSVQLQMSQLPEMRRFGADLSTRLASIAPSDSEAVNEAIRSSLTAALPDMVPLLDSLAARNIPIRTAELLANHVVPLHFGFDSTDVRDADLMLLAHFASVVKRKHPKAVITIEGFSDPAGTSLYNLQLSKRRALNVKDLLVTRFGLPAWQMKTVAHGEKLAMQVVPGAEGDQPGAEANRRVAFSIDLPRQQ
jgi:outer membrane protein OmpA-like peptidoglycan-associated protein